MNNYGPTQTDAHQYSPLAIKPNTEAWVSLVASLVTFFVLWIIPIVGMAGSMVGIVYGYKSLEQTKDIYQSGAGMAKTGIVIGYFSLAGTFLWSAFWTFWFVVFLREVKM